MTCTPPPLYSPASPFWMASFMMEQQMRLAQLCFETMMRANPWMVMIRTGSVDPLTADAALGEGDSPDDINLEAGVSSKGTASETPTPVARVTPKPAAKRAATSDATPAPARQAKTGAKAAPAAKRSATTRAKAGTPKRRAATRRSTAASPAPAPSAQDNAASAKPEKTDAKPARSRGRRQPSAPPTMPGGSDAPSEKGE